MELNELARLAFDAVTAGGLTLPNVVAVVALVAVVAALKLALAPRVPFFSTPAGVILLNVAVSGFAAVVTALAGGTAFTWALLGTTLVMSWKAAGGWTLLKHLWPVVEPLLVKIFPFMARGDAATTMTEAQKTGLAAAVVAKTPTSTDIANGP